MILRDRLKGKSLILGSQSPRRRELLAACDVEFVVAKDFDVEERIDTQLPADEVPEQLAMQKSMGYPTKLQSDQILITADTIVILDDQILGKPKGRDEAIAMLEAMSGKHHTVITGVVIRSSERSVSFSASTDVWFRSLRREEIEYYVDTYKPYDKAGAYGIQEWIGHIGIERIKGSFYNVMGLPIQTLYSRLEQFLEQK